MLFGFFFFEMYMLDSDLASIGYTFLHNPQNSQNSIAMPMHMPPR